MTKEEYVTKKIDFHGYAGWDKESFGCKLLTESFSLEYDCLKSIESLGAEFELVIEDNFWELIKECDNCESI